MSILWTVLYSGGNGDLYVILMDSSVQLCIVAVKVTYMSSFPLSSPNSALHIVASYKKPNWATLKCPAMGKAHLLSKLQNIVHWLSMRPIRSTALDDS